MRPSYRITWRLLLTRYRGHSKAIFTEEREAERVAAALNNEWAGVAHHWVESVP